MKHWEKSDVFFNSIFSRLIFSFLAIMIPILTISAVIYFWGKHSIEDEIMNSTTDQVDYMKSSLENEMSRIKSIEYNIVNDADLSKLINYYNTMPASEYYLCISKILNQLQVIKSSSIFIQDISIHLPQLESVVSTVNELDKFDDSYYMKMITSYRANPYPLILDSNAYSLMCYPAVFKEKPAYVLEAQLSKKAMLDYLTQFRNYKDDEIYIYNNQKGTWFAGSENKVKLSELPDIKILDKASEYGHVLIISGRKYLAIYDYSKALSISFVKLIQYDELFEVPNRYQVVLFVFWGVSLILICLYSYSMYKQVNHPIKKILKAFEKVEKGNLKVNLKFKTANEFVKLYEGFNNMVEKLDNTINSLYKEKIYAQKAELKQLQTQINPHFLYNSYFLLHMMIKQKDYDEAFELSAYIGKYFQYITRHAADEVPLLLEVEHMTNYANIQAIRFSGNVKIEIGALPETIKDFLVPRILLQPLLENAFNYGVRNRVSDGHIRVTFADEIHRVRVATEDNGDDLHDRDIAELIRKLECTDESLEVTGIINVHRRIRLRFGQNSGVNVTRSELGGLKAEITIEKRKQDK